MTQLPEQINYNVQISICADFYMLTLISQKFSRQSYIIISDKKHPQRHYYTCIITLLSNQSKLLFWHTWLNSQLVLIPTEFSRDTDTDKIYYLSRNYSIEYYWTKIWLLYMYKRHQLVKELDYFACNNSWTRKRSLTMSRIVCWYSLRILINQMIDRNIDNWNIFILHIFIERGNKPYSW